MSSTRTEWRRWRGIMKCYPFEQKRLDKWKPPYFVQPKLDGERCRAVPIAGAGTMVLLSSEENVIHSVPHIVEAVNKLFTNHELDGELYCPGMPFEEIHSRVGRTTNLHPDHTSIEFHIFDVIDSDPQFKRLHTLYDLVGIAPPLRLVPTTICWSFDEVIRAYDQLIAQGYEGMIVRHVDCPYVRKRSTQIMKFKPKKEDVYKIVGWKEEVTVDGVPKGTLGALTCASGDGEETFDVGTGFTRETRQTLWAVREDLIGKNVTVQYQHLTSGKHVPRFPVFVEVTP